jgi:hypothetical protein
MAGKQLRTGRFATNPAVHALARIEKSRGFRYGGRAIAVVGAVVVVVAELNDEDQYVSEALANAGIRIGLSVGLGYGGAALGTALGVVCGPAAVVCSPVFGAAIGGGAAAFGDWGGQRLTEYSRIENFLHRHGRRMDAWVEGM